MHTTYYHTTYMHTTYYHARHILSITPYGDTLWAYSVMARVSLSDGTSEYDDLTRRVSMTI